MTQALLHTTTLYRDRLIALEHQAVPHLHAAHAHMLSTLEPSLHALYSQIDATYAEMRQHQEEDEPAPKIPLTWLYEHRRLSTLTSQVEHAVTQFTASAQASIAHLTQQSQALGHEAATAQLHSVLKPVKPATEGEYHAPLVSLTRVVALEAVEGVRQSLIRGLTLGRNAQQIGKKITESLAKPLQRVIGVAVNIATSAYRWAVGLVYKANRDICIGWAWLATATACFWCASQDGSKHGLDEEMNSHNFCHCVQVPLFSDESQDGEEIEE